MKKKLIRAIKVGLENLVHPAVMKFGGDFTVAVLSKDKKYILKKKKKSYCYEDNRRKAVTTYMFFKKRKPRKYHLFIFLPHFRVLQDVHDRVQRGDAKRFQKGARQDHKIQKKQRPAFAPYEAQNAF